MIPGILVISLGLIVFALGIRALVKGQSLGNLYSVSRERMPLRFWTSVVTDLVGGATCLAIGVFLLIQAG